VVIGNPPYVRQEGLGEFKGYFQKHFQVYQGTADLYAYFIERGVSLLQDEGIFSYIVANKWMRAHYGQPLRRWLKEQCIEEIIDFGDLPVFLGATTYPCIIRIARRPPLASFQATQVKTLNFNDLCEYVNENNYKVNQLTLDDSGWSLADEATQALLDKLKGKGVPLGEYVRGKIYYGIKTGLNEAFVIDAQTRERLIAEDPKSTELIKPFLAGRDIKRYQQPVNDKYLILIPRGWTREKSSNAKDALGWLKGNYPAIANHLLPFAQAAQRRYDKGEQWWELRACEYYNEFEKPKIIIPAIVRSASYAYDLSSIYSNDKTSIIPTNDLHLLGILGSKLADFIIHSISSTKQGGYFEYKPMYISQIPISVIDFSDPADVAHHDRMVSLVDRMLALHKQLQDVRTPHEKIAIQRQIEATDRQIDALVYELYGLTEEEIRIVEGR
jgi:NOL1/NOP2/fmu family ribosome biogenesis protein